MRCFRTPSLFVGISLALASLAFGVACDDDGHPPLILDGTGGGQPVEVVPTDPGSGVGTDTGTGAVVDTGTGVSTGTGVDTGTGVSTGTGTATGTGTGTAAELPSVGGSCSGWASRYWDCCKPHCAWRGNVSGSPTAQCDQNDNRINSSEPDTVMSACNGGPAHMCHSMAPWVSRENSNLSYGFAAVTNTGDVCGRCYRIQFNGASHNGGSNPGAQAINGKQMILQVTNVGGVETGQFDILIPGGGVGDFNACSNQWGTSDIGAQYGGFLTTCQQSLGYNAPLDSYKSCVAQKCDAIFGGGKFPELHAGCMWFVDWYQAADNPSFVYEPTTCPSEITGASGLTAQSPAGGC